MRESNPSKQLKNAFRQIPVEKRPSLREFARQCAAGKHGAKLTDAAKCWLARKREE